RRRAFPRRAVGEFRSTLFQFPGEPLHLRLTGAQFVLPAFGLGGALLMRPGLRLELVALGKSGVGLLPQACRLAGFFPRLVELRRGLRVPRRTRGEFGPGLFLGLLKRRNALGQSIRLGSRCGSCRRSGRGPGRLNLVASNREGVLAVFAGEPAAEVLLADAQGVPTLGARHVDGFTHGGDPWLESSQKWVPNPTSIKLQFTVPRCQSTIPQPARIRQMPTRPPPDHTHQSRSSPANPPTTAGIQAPDSDRLSLDSSHEPRRMINEIGSQYQTSTATMLFD